MAPQRSSWRRLSLSWRGAGTCIGLDPRSSPCSCSQARSQASARGLWPAAAHSQRGASPPAPTPLLDIPTLESRRGRCGSHRKPAGCWQSQGSTCQRSGRFASANSSRSLLASPPRQGGGGQGGQPASWRRRPAGAKQAARRSTPPPSGLPPAKQHRQARPSAAASRHTGGQRACHSDPPPLATTAQGMRPPALGRSQSSGRAGPASTKAPASHLAEGCLSCRLTSPAPDCPRPQSSRLGLLRSARKHIPPKQASGAVSAAWRPQRGPSAGPAASRPLTLSGMRPPCSGSGLALRPSCRCGQRPVASRSSPRFTTQGEERQFLRHPTPLEIKAGLTPAGSVRQGMGGGDRPWSKQQ